MANPSWQKTLAEVLNQKTIQLTKTSKSGKEYTTDVVPELFVKSTGSLQENDDNTVTYSVVDVENHFEYAVKAPNLVAVEFGTDLIFKNVAGGQTNSGSSWFKADYVQLVK